MRLRRVVSAMHFACDQSRFPILHLLGGTGLAKVYVYKRMTRVMHRPVRSGPYMNERVHPLVSHRPDQKYGILPLYSTCIHYQFAMVSTLPCPKCWKMDDERSGAGRQPIQIQIRERETKKGRGNSKKDGRQLATQQASQLPAYFCVPIHRVMIITRGR